MSATSNAFGFARATAAVEKSYASYIKRNQADAERLKKFEHLEIPADFRYAHIKALSNEARQKLEVNRPLTLAQAARVPGVTPGEVQLLWVLLEKGSKNER